MLLTESKMTLDTGFGEATHTVPTAGAHIAFSGGRQHDSEKSQ